MGRVKDQIEDKGTEITLVYRLPLEPPDPSKPWHGNDPVEERVVTKGILCTAKHIKYGLAVDNQKDSSGVDSEEMRVLVAAEGLPRSPSLDSTLIYNSVIWSIVSVIPLRPSGDDIIYTIQVRR